MAVVNPDVRTEREAILLKMKEQLFHWTRQRRISFDIEESGKRHSYIIKNPKFTLFHGLLTNSKIVKMQKLKQICS